MLYYVLAVIILAAVAAVRFFFASARAEAANAPFEVGASTPCAFEYGHGQWPRYGFSLERASAWYVYLQEGVWYRALLEEGDEYTLVTRRTRLSVGDVYYEAWHAENPRRAISVLRCARQDGVLSADDITRLGTARAGFAAAPHLVAAFKMAERLPQTAAEAAEMADLRARLLEEAAGQRRAEHAARELGLRALTLGASLELARAEAAARELGDTLTAWYFREAERERGLEDELEPEPVPVWAARAEAPTKVGGLKARVITAGRAARSRFNDRRGGGRSWKRHRRYQYAA